MAVGDFVFDKKKPPPTLTRALNYEKWGIGDVMQLPAGLLSRMNTALFYLRACRGYQSASNRTVPWAKEHPTEWEAVTYIIDQRRKRKRGDSNQ